MPAPAPYRRHFEVAAKLAETRRGGVPFERTTLESWLGLPSDERRPRAQQAFASCPITEPQCALEVAFAMFEGLDPGTAIEIPGFDEGEPFILAELAMYVYFCTEATLDAIFIEAMQCLFNSHGVTQYVRKAADGKAEEVVADTTIFTENTSAVEEVSQRRYFSQLAHVLERYIISSDYEHVMLLSPEVLGVIDEIEKADHQPEPQVRADIREYKARVYFALSSAAMNLEQVYVDPKTKEELTSGDVYLRGMVCAYGVNTDQLRRPRPTFTRPTRREVVWRLTLFAAIAGGLFAVTRRLKS